MAKAAKKSAKKTAKGRSSARPSSAKASGGRKSAARKTSGAKKAGGAKKKTARRPNAAFMAPVTPSPDLSQVVGNKPMPRTEITKRLWAYIKKNGLQDQKNRRMINADDNLRPVFGGKSSVSMFDMTKLVNKHLK